MAASSTNTLVLTVIATAALSQFRAATVAGAVPAAGGNSLGFAVNGGAVGEAVPIVAGGTAIAEAGAAVSLGAALELDAAGRVVPRTSGVTVARALTAAAASGDQVEVLLIPN